MGKWWVRGLLVVAVILMAISIAYAQFAIPISDRTITGSLFISGKPLADFEIREGAMLAVRDEDQGFWYAVVPRLDQNPQHVLLKGFELTPDAVEEAPRVVEVLKALDVPIGRAVALPLGRQSFLVTIKAVQRGYFPTVPAVKNPRGMNPEFLKAVYSSSGGGICSLTCDSTTITSTYVSMACGTCSGAR